MYIINIYIYLSLCPVIGSFVHCKKMLDTISIKLFIGLKTIAYNPIGNWCCIYTIVCIARYDYK